MKIPLSNKCILKTRFWITRKMIFIKVKYKKVIGVCMESEYLMISQRVAEVYISRKAKRERVGKLKDKIFHLVSLKTKAHKGAQRLTLQAKCQIKITIMID